MKSVLISIQPKWCELIASGKKTVEVRKTAPKLETPFKCYIYETKVNRRQSYYNVFHEKTVGKVVGEFVCDRIDEYTFSNLAADYRVNHIELDAMCLNYKQLIEYGKGKPLYGWYITDLKIYNKPKELSEFCIPCKVSCAACKKPAYFESGCSEKGRKSITRPPQSWCYVEEL